MNSKRTRQEIAAAIQMPKKEEDLKEGKEEDYVPYTIQCEIFR